MLSVACTAGCPRWNSYVDQNALFAVRFTRYRTARDCRDFCSRLLQCVAIDYDANSDLCWLHFDSANLFPDNIYNLPNVTQFVVDRSCAVDDTTTSTTATATTTTSTTTTTTTTTHTTTTSITTGTNTTGTTLQLNQYRLAMKA